MRLKQSARQGAAAVWSVRRRRDRLGNDAFQNKTNPDGHGPHPIKPHHETETVDADESSMLAVPSTKRDPKGGVSSTKVNQGDEIRTCDLHLLN